MTYKVITCSFQTHRIKTINLGQSCDIFLNHTLDYTLYNHSSVFHFLESLHR